MSTRLARNLTILLIFVFLILGVVYSVATPIFEPTDELTHYPVIQHIASGRGLPVQVPGQATLWRQEGSQPPLYYMLAAAATFWVDTGDLPGLIQGNPHAYVGIPLSDGNKNQVVHTSREAFPWQGTTLAIHLIRFLSLALGACTVYLTRRLALVVFPGRQWLALAVAALVAFNPMFLFISASATNDNLAITLASLAILVMVSALAAHPPARSDLRWAAGLGGILGLAALTKLSLLALLPLAALVVAVRAWRLRSWTTLFAEGAAMGAVALLVAGWWYARNWLLYGDPTGLSTLVDMMGRREVTPGLLGLLPELEGLRISFWALFGAMNVIGDLWIYPVADALTLAAVAGLAVAGVRRKVPGLLWLPSLWVVALGAALVRYSQMLLAFQGRLLFPGLQSIALLLALGLVSLLPGRWGGRLLAAAIAALAAVAIISPFRYIIPAYPGPDLLPSLNDAAIAHPLHITYDGRGELVGYAVDRETVRPGDELTLTLYWRSVKPFDADYSLYMHITSPDGVQVAKRDTLPGKGSYPTTLWQPGQAFRDTYRLTISPQAAGPARLRLEAGLYDLATLVSLPTTDGQGRAVDSRVLGYLKLAGDASPPPTIPNPLAYRMGENIVLGGYDVKAGSLPGTLRLTLYWQPSGRPSADYAVFAHLLDAGGNLVGQGDGEPLGGRYPTSFWDAGETIVDTYDIAAQPGTPPGRYHLAVGMYDRANGHRLPITGADGQPAGDSVTITIDLR